MCDPDAGRFLFSNMNAMLTRSTLSDVVRYAQLTIDECTQFFVRGACRISGNFAIFCKIFAQNLRDLDAGLARYLALERTSTQKRVATKFCSSCNHDGRIDATFLRGWSEDRPRRYVFHSAKLPTIQILFGGKFTTRNYSCIGYGYGFLGQAQRARSPPS